MRLRRDKQPLNADQKLRKKRQRADNIAKMLTLAGWIGGWLIVTLGAYGFVGLWITAWWIWPISVGLLMIGFSGFKTLRLIFAHGVYVLKIGLEEDNE